MDQEVLGVDIGGVIMDRINDGTDTSFFTDNYLRTTAVPGVLDALGRLTRGRFHGRVHLVSKCGRKVQEKTKHWLQHHDFYSITGISPAHVHFCRQRHEKAGICKELGITHFVDDRLEVLSHLVGIVPNLFLFDPQEAEVQKFKQHLGQVRTVYEWSQIEQALK